MTQQLKLQLLGANRGGRAFTHAMLEALRPLPQNLTVQIVDREPHRAEELASLWREAGISAYGLEGLAEEVSSQQPADCRVVALDDLTATQQVVGVVGKENQRHLLFGFMIVSPTSQFGGRVIGVGGSFGADDPFTASQAHTLVNQFSRIVGTRTRSHELSAPIFNSIQTNNTRLLLHQELAHLTIASLLKGQTLNSLFVVEKLSPPPTNIHKVITLTPVSQRTARRELRHIALEIATVQSTPPNAAVVFYDPDEAWLYLALLTFKDRWFIKTTVEFPPPRILEEATRRRVAATD